MTATCFSTMSASSIVVESLSNYNNQNIADDSSYVTISEPCLNINNILITNVNMKQQISSSSPSLSSLPKTSCNSTINNDNRDDIENSFRWDHPKSSSSSSPSYRLSRSKSLDTPTILEIDTVPCHPSSSFTNNKNNNKNANDVTSNNNNIDNNNSISNINNNDANALHLPSNTMERRQKVFQLIFGAMGIYFAYLYYAHVQEELFHYRDPIHQTGFSFVWFLQVLESSITIILGWSGRRYYSTKSEYNDDKDNTNIKSVNVKETKMPFLPFFKAGASQLGGKVLMSLSLTYGLAFPVVVLAKSGKVVPVMIGQILLGGSKYHTRDYIFSILLVVGTAMLSINSTDAYSENQDTTVAFGVLFLILSLFLDGLTGGLQKKLKNETALYEPTTYDFLYYSHITMFTISLIMCQITGEFHNAIYYCRNNPNIWIWLLPACLCSAMGQCFIFYIITAFDPFVCTTITTTRKMISVLFSIFFKEHIEVSNIGMIGLLIAFIALIIEIEGKMRYHHHQHHPKRNIIDHDYHMIDHDVPRTTLRKVVVTTTMNHYQQQQHTNKNHTMTDV